MLIVGGIDLEGAVRLSSWMVLKKMEVDLCLAGGPFPPASYPSPAGEPDLRGRSNEEAEGDMTSILALLENIVCR